MERKLLSVYELTTKIKFLLESSFPYLRVIGEVSNIKTSSLGHTYFTLKDDLSQINCVFFNSKRSLYLPKDGERIIVHGRISVYERSGQYQIIVEVIEQAGKGALWLAFEKLKEKLKKEGLFDEKHKKPLPFFPESVAIVTSTKGAAKEDLLRTLPDIEITIFGARVQGEGSSYEIASRIYEINRLPKKPDIIIVARGGGSLEDLWSFNEEIIARAIFSSKIPIISAVGHEIDFTISDMIADIRAPTPTAAGHMISQIRQKMKERIELAGKGLLSKTKNIISKERITLDHLYNSFVFKRPRLKIEEYYQEIDELSEKAKRALLVVLEIRKNKLTNTTNIFKIRVNNILLSFHKRLASLEKIISLDPTSILKRGYSITYKDKIIIKDQAQVKDKDKIRIKFYKGEIYAEVQSNGS